MKTLFFLLSICGSLSLFSQATVTLNADRDMSSTWVFTEDTVVEGNDFSLSCDGCDYMIIVDNNATVTFNNVKFNKGYERWLSVRSGAAYWNSKFMTGYIINTNDGQNQ